MPTPLAQEYQEKFPERAAALQDSVVHLDEPIVESTGPVWKGPTSPDPQGGISQSLIGSWLSCRERFRVETIEGWCLPEGFSAPLEFGNLFHCAEEAYAKRSHSQDILNSDPTVSDWAKALDEQYTRLLNQFPFDREEVRHWYMMALALFPRYTEWWDAHHDLTERTPLLSETCFRVPYVLSSGRVVHLRGKWDSVDLIESGPEAGVWIQENKTKSAIDSQGLTGQMQFDLQSLVYIVALQTHLDQVVDGEGPLLRDQTRGMPIRGIRYNVIKRPAHKSVENMIKSLVENLQAGRSEEWFWRRNVSVTEQDIEKFKTQCLNPVLENICDDYEWWTCENIISPYSSETRHKLFPHHQNRCYRKPYGVWDPLSGPYGGFGDVDKYLNTGSTAGLVRAKQLFPELQEV